MAHQDKLLTGSGDGYIQFAVDECTLDHDGLREQPHRMRAMDGGAKDNEVTLAALIALDCVYGDGVGAGHPCAAQGMTDCSNLGTKGYDDAHTARHVLCVDIGLLHKVQISADDCGYHMGFGGVGLFRQWHLIGHDIDSEQSVCRKGALHAVGGRIGEAEWLHLVGQGYGAQAVAIIIGIDEGANVGVHAALHIQMAQTIHTIIAEQMAVQTFEQRTVHATEVDVVHLGRGGLCTLRRLLYDCR